MLLNPQNMCSKYKAQFTNSGGKEINLSVFFYEAIHFVFGAPALFHLTIFMKHFCQNSCCPRPHNPLSSCASLLVLRHTWSTDILSQNRPQFRPPEGIL